MILWFSCVGTDPQEPSPLKPLLALEQGVDVAQVSSLAGQYSITESFSGSMFFSLLSQKSNADYAFSYNKQKDTSIRYRWLHLPTGTYRTGESTRSAEDIFLTSVGALSKESSPTVAYAGAPWFSGSFLAQQELLTHMQGYFTRMEADDRVVRVAHKDLPIFKGTVQGEFLSLSAIDELGLSCSVMHKKSYWCTFPELDKKCIQQTVRWLQEVFSWNFPQTSQGKYFYELGDKNVGICVPSGCYWCARGGCSLTEENHGLPLSVDQENWFVCVEQNFDDDAQKTRVCFSEKEFLRKQGEMYVDDCRKP